MSMDTKAFAREVEKHVHPATFPIVLKLLRESDHFPLKAKRPLQDMKRPIPMCGAIDLVRRAGCTLVLGDEDLTCSFNGELWSQGKAELSLSFGEPKGQYKYLAILPAACSDIMPDAVVIYCNSAQMLRLATGAMWNHGAELTNLLAARINCSEGLLRTMLSRDYRVIIPGCAHKSEDGEIAFCVPGERMDALAEGLEQAASWMRPIGFSSDDRAS
jgi:uncharacterized protein (DUF169 family)